MTDIPEDVMKAATDVVVGLGIGGSDERSVDGFTVRDAIARAILAERERIQREGLPGWVRIAGGEPDWGTVPIMWEQIDKARVSERRLTDDEAAELILSMGNP